MLGALVSLAVLMLALSRSYRHTRHSWFFRPDVAQLEVRLCAGRTLQAGDQGSPDDSLRTRMSLSCCSAYSLSGNEALCIMCVSPPTACPVHVTFQSTLHNGSSRSMPCSAGHATVVQLLRGAVPADAAAGRGLDEAAQRGARRCALALGRVTASRRSRARSCCCSANGIGSCSVPDSNTRRVLSGSTRLLRSHAAGCSPAQSIAHMEFSRVSSKRS